MLPCSSLPVGYLWEFQSISLNLHLSQECCVRNQNSPHILRIINFPAIAGEYTVTAMWVKTTERLPGCKPLETARCMCSLPCQKSAPYLMGRYNLVISGCQGFIMIKFKTCIGFFPRSTGTWINVPISVRPKPAVFLFISCVGRNY